MSDYDDYVPEVPSTVGFSMTYMVIIITHF